MSTPRHYAGPMLERPAAGNVPGGSRFLDTTTGIEYIEHAGAWVTASTTTLVDTTTAANTLLVDPNANKSASTSVGGAILVENTGSTGAGVVVFSNRGADQAGRLIVARSANAAFAAAAIAVDYLGTNHAMTIAHGGTGASSLALSIVSTNESDTALGVTGPPSGRGTIKVTHNKPAGADTNASLISGLINGAGTACQGIFIDTEAGVTTTGKLIALRQNGAEVFSVAPDGKVSISAVQVLGPRVTGWGAPTGTKTRTTFDPATVTLSQLAERVAALIDDARAHGLIGN